MKTFSDLLAIDTSELLHITTVLREQGNITYDFAINGICTQDLRIPLLGDIIITCNVYNVEPGSGLEIVNIAVNNLEIMPIYLHRSTPQTSYLNQVGCWEFRISAPFYTWYHEISGQGWLLEPNECI